MNIELPSSWVDSGFFEASGGYYSVNSVGRLRRHRTNPEDARLQRGVWYEHVWPLDLKQRASAWIITIEARMSTIDSPFIFVDGPLKDLDERWGLTDADAYHFVDWLREKKLANLRLAPAIDNSYYYIEDLSLPEEKRTESRRGSCDVVWAFASAFHAAYRFRNIPRITNEWAK